MCIPTLKSRRKAEDNICLLLCTAWPAEVTRDLGEREKERERKEETIPMISWRGSPLGRERFWSCLMGNKPNLFQPALYSFTSSPSDSTHWKRVQEGLEPFQMWSRSLVFFSHLVSFTLSSSFKVHTFAYMCIYTHAYSYIKPLKRCVFLIKCFSKRVDWLNWLNFSAASLLLNQDSSRKGPLKKWRGWQSKLVQRSSMCVVLHCWSSITFI